MSYLSYFTYILKSLKDESLYYGSTSDLSKRQTEHDSKKSNYTKRKGPFDLIYYAVFIGKDAKEKAIKFEKWLKSGSGRAFVKRHIL
jgi:predicted GIY-YIG superfamily endonuclease